LATASAQVCVPLGHSSLYLFLLRTFEYTRVFILQRVQNAAARVLLELSTKDHVTPSLAYRYSSCIGFLCAGVLSSNCAALCIQFSTANTQPILDRHRTVD